MNSSFVLRTKLCLFLPSVPSEHLPYGTYSNGLLKNKPTHGTLSNVTAQRAKEMELMRFRKVSSTKMNIKIVSLNPQLTG